MKLANRTHFYDEHDKISKIKKIRIKNGNIMKEYHRTGITMEYELSEEECLKIKIKDLFIRSSEIKEKICKEDQKKMDKAFRLKYPYFDANKYFNKKFLF